MAIQSVSSFQLFIVFLIVLLANAVMPATAALSSKDKGADLLVQSRF
jgi:hypothetical protein